MNKPLVCLMGILTAVIVALILSVFAQDVLDIPERTVVIGSLASAGMICLAFVSVALRGRM
jgi:hypothetical protein